MLNSAASRFRFIAHALNGDGPFRPVVTVGTNGDPVSVSASYLVRYPRESEEKFQRRNELAFYSSPLWQVTSRFVGYLTEQPPIRDLPHPLYQAIAENADGKGNALDVFWQSFMLNAKARGTMLLLVDMPPQLPASLAGQIQNRAAPYLTQIAPELVTEYELGADGRFVYVAFSGTFIKENGESVPCIWRFDAEKWQALDLNKKPLAGSAHPLGTCPVLIFVEGYDFPCFGSFAPIADLARRLFNLDSELDEILRSQTFSLLTMQVTEGSTSEQKLDAARVVGETIGTANLMVHSGQTPQFIAPPDGPAKIYLERIDKLRAQIEDIGLAIASPQSRESGISMQMRFHSINAALSSFAGRMEDFERRMWELCARWLGMTVMPTTSWTRDYTIADVDKELQVLTQMNANAMPKEVIVEQQKRICALQFSASEETDAMFAAIEEQEQERSTTTDAI